MKKIILFLLISTVIFAEINIENNNSFFVAGMGQSTFAYKNEDNYRYEDYHYNSLFFKYIINEPNYLVSAKFSHTQNQKIGEFTYTTGSTSNKYEEELEKYFLNLSGGIKFHFDKLFVRPSIFYSYATSNSITKYIKDSSLYSRETKITDNDFGISMGTGYEYSQHSFIYAEYDIITDLFSKQEEWDVHDLEIGVYHFFNDFVINLTYRESTFLSRSIKKISSTNIGIGSKF